ncbi:hypothetical protein M408DRAFT_323363 [Serendipita vermifera MAFF 305830]|uniref:GST C-terminal domain-containing protein n=1 Tax=Serendipita vermifera MAFF 305830 TaxID=933852 RepID=A0A0C3BGI8_SERVB|nr:hypothetical protein M408DRAFT_323363 [Serendipita vermifera MAFF 305830]
MVTLYRFQHDPMRFCDSTYVNKLDALLTFSGLDGIKYESGKMSKAPRGKFPFIELDGAIIPDSELAYRSCIDKGLVECLDRGAGLSDKEAAISLSYRALVERNLEEIMGYERWMEHWYETRDKILGDIPALMRPVLAYWLVYRPTSAKYWHTEISRITPEERQRNLESHVRALAAIIPKAGYIMGKATPTRIDATIFGFLTSLIRSPELSPKMIAEVDKYPHIFEYRNRLASEFWPQRKLVN